MAVLARRGLRAHERSSPTSRRQSSIAARSASRRRSESTSASARGSGRRSPTSRAAQAGSPRPRSASPRRAGSQAPRSSPRSCTRKGCCARSRARTRRHCAGMRAARKPSLRSLIPAGANCSRSSSRCARAQARFRQGSYDEALKLATAVVNRANELGDLRNLAHAYYLEPRHPYVARQPRAAHVPRACAADLRGDRRSRRPGERPQQPRDRGVLRRPLGRGTRPLRTKRQATRADRRRHQRRDDDEQRRRDRVRPGAIRETPSSGSRRLCGSPTTPANG